MNVATALNLLQGTGVQITDNRPAVWTFQPGQLQETQDNPHRQFNPIFSRRAAVELQPE